MSTIDLFPTKIYKSAIQTEWPRDAIIDYLENDYFTKQPGDKSNDQTLHKHPLFQELVKFFLDEANAYWSTLEYTDTWRLSITHMWANRLVKGGPDSAWRHIHSPSFISGCFYVNLDSPDMGYLYFIDPNERVLQTQPLGETRRYSPEQQVPAQTGDLLMFPGWIEHGTCPNTTDRIRYSVAFNLGFTGLDLYKKIMEKK